jgi:dynein heavy chain
VPADPDTRDWTDGLLSSIFREMARPVVGEKEERRYLVFDGDVDALWVEDMNSLMDDNKLLTLPNGERIRLPNHCKLLFEVRRLQGRGNRGLTGGEQQESAAGAANSFKRAEG